jgi:hypothetical protein
MPLWCGSRLSPLYLSFVVAQTILHIGVMLEMIVMKAKAFLLMVVSLIIGKIAKDDEW